MSAGSAVKDTFGPIFVGVVLNIALYGIMIMQTYLYFNVYKRDKKWIKALILFLFFCDTINTCFDIAFLYDTVINNFGNEAAVEKASWVFATDPFMTAFIAFLVQIFFAWRVKVLTSNVITVSVIAVCSFFQLCGGLGSTIAIRIIPQFAGFRRGDVIVIIWLVFSFIADTLITTALVWHLRKQKTGMAATDDVVNRIIRMTVQTGLVTTIWVITDLILFLVSPLGYHLIFNLPLSKLYTNSLMSSLNSRAGWQYDSSDPVSPQSPQDNRPPRFPHWVRQHGNLSILTSNNDPALTVPQQIFIDVESHEMVDLEEGKGVVCVPEQKVRSSHCEDEEDRRSVSD